VLSCQQAHGGENRVSEGRKDIYYRDEAWFLPRLYDCARAAGVAANAPEMRHFCRWTFASARRLASIGEAPLAEEMLQLARRTASGAQWEFIAMSAAAYLLGWKKAANLAENLRSRFMKKAGRDTMPGW
jgi:hypothetical protein